MAAMNLVALVVVVVAVTGNQRQKLQLVIHSVTSASMVVTMAVVYWVAI